MTMNSEGNNEKQDIPPGVHEQTRREGALNSPLHILSSAAASAAATVTATVSLLPLFCPITRPLGVERSHF